MPSSDPADHAVASALPEVHTWTGRPTAENLTVLPGGPAVLLFTDEHGRPVQLLTTQQLKRFALSRLGEAETARRGRADLAAVVRGVRWRAVHCPFEARWWYYRLARGLHPREYRKLMSFGPSWFLHVDWGQPIPEIRATERVWCGDGGWIGPWATRKAAQEALTGLWDLFDLCRYPEQVRKAPGGTRCAYAEMGRCDAPCDGSAPVDAYTERCRAAWRFAGGDGVDEWMGGARQRMKQAALEQRYELAAQIKQQLEFADKWRQQWAGRVVPVDRLNYLLVVPVTRRRAWKLVLFWRGFLADGPVVTDRRIAVDAAAWVREALSQREESADEAVRMEQTWLVCQLLHNREGNAAIVVPLPDLAVPDDLEKTLPERVVAWRAQRRAEKTEPRAVAKTGRSGCQAERATPTGE